MASLFKKTTVVIFLLILIFLIFSKPVGERIEEKRRDKLEKICYQISKETIDFQHLKQIYRGYETFKLGGVSSFSASINRTLDFTTEAKTRLTKEKFPEEMKNFQNQCKTKTEELDKDLQKNKPAFDYLARIYPTYKNLKNSLEEAEDKKYQGFVGQLRQVKENQKKFEQDLNAVAKLTPPQIFKESKLYLKKALSGIVDFWTNAEVAVVRRTPVIFSSALRVSRGDWQQMEKVMIKEFSYSL